MGSWSLNGTFTACPDPDYEPFRRMVVGAFLNGKPVYQGKESGLIKWPTPIPSAALNEVRARWQANSGSQTSGNLPAISGYGWRAVSAYWGEPLPTGWDGPLAAGVSMPVYYIGNY